MKASFKFPKWWGLTAVLFLLSTTTLKSQQKIQIKDGTANVGHFFVEILHNMAGSPMKAFSGNGGSIQVKDDRNKFILRMQNFIWYNPDENVELEFNVDQINVMGEGDVSFEQKEKIVSLKSVNNYIRDIFFSVEGDGLIKLSLPFSYEGGNGRFLQEFTINKGEPSTAIKDADLSSNEVKKIWKELDKDSEEEVKKFITRFEGTKGGKRSIKIAKSTLEDIKAKKLLVAEKERREEIKKSYESRGEIKEESGREEDEEISTELDSDKLMDDLQKTVENIDLKEASAPDVDRFHVLTLLFNESNEELKVHETEMPLQINLKELGHQEMQLINAVSIPSFMKDSTVSLDIDLLKENNIKGEFSSFNLVNAQGIELLSRPIELTNAKGSESKTMMYIMGLGGLLLLLGAFLFFSRRSKEKKRQETKIAFQEKIKANLQAQEQKTGMKPGTQVAGSAPSLSTSGGAKSKIVIGQKTSKRTSESLTPAQSVPRKAGSSGRIKITKKKTSGIPIAEESFAALVKETKTVNIDLKDIWSDSRISKVYLGSEFIKELDNFLADSSNDGIQNELQGAIPEVGGFMMGRFTDNGNNLEILVEKFVPFVPEYNDVFKIEIGTKTIVDELGDAQDKNPNLDVIGWFHTHPGHGLFLSTSDLSVQRHFAMDHQVAMEIDSLTPGLDMSIFTRKSNGQMNNSVDRREGMGWFRWVDIENSNVG